MMEQGRELQANCEIRLNEAALALLALRPGDLPGVVHFGKLLSSYTAAVGVASEDAKRVAEAAALVDTVIISERNLDEVIGPIGALLEEAMNLVDTPEAKPAAGTMGTLPDAPLREGLPPDADLELLADWTVESLEYLAAAEAALLALETDPSDAEAINVVFRGFHTIKGTAAFLDLGVIVDLAHHAESLLSRVRDGELMFTPACADLALRSADLLRELVQGVQAALGGELMRVPAGYAALVEELGAPDVSLLAVEPDGTAEPVRLGDILVHANILSREQVERAAAEQGDQPLGIALVQRGAAKTSDVARALRRQRSASEPRAADAAEVSDSSVRVRTDRLDRLMDLVGELVVAQSMIAEDDTLANREHHQLARKVHQAGKLVRELQALTTSMRMVPLKGTFQRLARLVRDVSRKTGKQVALVTDGEETEIDRNMVDVVADPLVHMVRNAIDHGVENPAERRAAGKPEMGTVRLVAYHQGSNVVVELHDDGRGLERDRILAKALAKGLIETEAGLSDSEIYGLIFTPGFSTAEQVTDVSGRGVGMDVVRRSIEVLQGRVDIASEPGCGSTFTIRLPLTLAITEGMLVRVGSERYIVPTGHIYQSFRPEPQMLSTVAGKGEVVLQHDRVIPLVRLHRLFDIVEAEADPTRATLMLVGDASHRAALLVDEILGQQQFVAKPLGNGLGKADGLAGGAVLGDGQVGLILDVAAVLSLFQATSARTH